MALVFNSTTIPNSGSVRFNNTDMQSVRMNNVEYWKRQKKVYPGIGVANSQNTSSYQPYWKWSNDGSTLHVESFGGTDTGSGWISVGPFSTVGYSKAFFDRLTITKTTNTGGWVKIGIGNVNCGFHYTFIEGTGHGLGTTTYYLDSKWNIDHNSAYYLLIMTSASADYSGHTVKVDITGFYLE